MVGFKNPLPTISHFTRRSCAQLFDAGAFLKKGSLSISITPTQNKFGTKITATQNKFGTKKALAK